MSAPPPASGAMCRVVGESRLPAESGGAGALCGAVERAVAAQAPGSGAQVEVRVLSSSMMEADVTLSGGSKLPTQTFASSDRPLAATSFERFANAIAAEIARASAR